MDRLKRVLIAAVVLLGAGFWDAAPSSAAAGATANLVAGWNLLGNSSGVALNAVTAFGDSARVTTVWKWVPVTSTWAFYTPLQADGGAAYAAAKGYDLLTSIESGEGFWVNAKAAFTAELPAGTSLTSASFRGSLAAGWNLIASGDNKTPSQFNQALSTAPPPFGTIPVNLITLWSWDAVRSNWYFYAPSLEAGGGTILRDYVEAKGYLDYGAKAFDPANGFWVNRSAPPAFITLAATNVSSATPMSIVTLSGSGFDPTAITTVRFFDAAQYSVDVRPIRLSNTSITVGVPPYFDSTGSVFAPGVVSVKVIQTSRAGTRSSGALAGFQILDLPDPGAPAGAVTLNFLQSLQTQATALQTSITGTALDSAALRSSLASQVDSLAPLIAAVQSVVLDASNTVALGTAQGLALNVGASELRQTDRLLLGMFLALGVDTTGLASAGEAATASLPPAWRGAATLQLAFNGALERLAIWVPDQGLPEDMSKQAASMVLRGLIRLAQVSASGGCMQVESSAYANCVRDLGAGSCSTLSTVTAGQESVPCRSAGAFNTGLTVIAAGLVAGVGVTALIFGASVGTVAGTAGVLALAGYLAYATVATGLVQIGIGGTLGQTSAGARELVEGGVKQLNDFVRDTTVSLGVGTVAGETAGYINDVLISAINLGGVLGQTASTATTTTTAPTTSTTTTTTTSSTATTSTTSIIAPTSSTTTLSTSTTTLSTTTTTIGDAACYAQYETCLAKPACNPPSDLITQSQCTNACIGALLACY